MGGGGGGSGGSFGGGQGLERLRERAEEQAARAQFDSEVNARLDEELRSLNNRDVELVRRRLDELEEALGDEVDEIDRMLFGGSIAKHTFVDGLSDVDVLVMLKAVADLSRHNPQCRLVTPAEVADTVLWLCGEGAGAITGQAIAVAGGEV